MNLWSHRFSKKMISAVCTVPQYRAEILTMFGSYFGWNDDFINSFWNLLTFSLAENTQMPQNLSVQFLCPSPKVLDFNEKRLHWVFVVHGSNKRKLLSFQKRVFMSWCCSCHSFVKCCFMFKYEHCEKAQSLTG